MSRPKMPVPDQPWVPEDGKQKRQLQGPHEAKHKNGHAKPVSRPAPVEEDNPNIGG